MTDSEADTAESQPPTPRARKRASVTAVDQPDVCRVGVKVPPFWPEKPAIWFAQLEGQFVISRITDDTTKFYHVIGQLEHQYAAEVEDIITSPPDTDKYENLKAELLKRLCVSKENKVKQLLMHEELGDRKPTQFLRHLRHLGGPDVPEDFLKTIWTSRLPSSMQTIVASQATSSLDALAELADRIHDIVPGHHLSAVASSRPTSAMEEMAKQIAALTKQVSALTAHVHGDRSRSRDRRPPQRRDRRSPSTRSQSSYRKHPICWHHWRFRDQAKRCIQPCDFTAGNGQEGRK
ncbi:uncharacterized protein LOC125489112 [Plutella xylostella]|uniref:uncharacterized protein LOC125489112 n=1 Tax=Plutella xylostella TaxID=51655 RepID=UPI0020330F84|nr:uncharacterized protein LOC125489112 [Plutella xylostella]